MPMDSTLDPYGYPRDYAFYKQATWRKKFLWWPQRCDLTGGWIWLCSAMEGSATWTGFGEPVHEYKYHRSEEHLVWILKGRP